MMLDTHLMQVREPAEKEYEEMGKTARCGILFALSQDESCAEEVDE